MSHYGDNPAPNVSPECGGGPKNGHKKNGNGKNNGPKDTEPKTPTKAVKGEGVMTDLGLTSIESLLFFNMLRFNKTHTDIDWDQVAIHSNLKNAASAKVRFRQILKKHNLLALAPETPRTQAQKRKAAEKTREGPDEDEEVDADPSHNPSPVAPKAAVRKRSTRTGGGLLKKHKMEAKSEDNRDDEEAASEEVVAASAPTHKADPDEILDTNPSMKIEVDPKTEIKADAKTNSQSGSDDGTNAVGVVGSDGTNSASPHEYVNDQPPQAFSAGWSYLMSPNHLQGNPPFSIGDPQMMQYQLRHPGMVQGPNGGSMSHHIIPPLTPSQLGLFQPPTPQLQPQQMTAEEQQHRIQLMRQAQTQQFNRFESMQMNPGLVGMEEMPGSNLPFGHMTRMQLNEHVPEDAYHGHRTYFDQARLGHGSAYGTADLDGQDEWDVESDNFMKEVKPEAENEDEDEHEAEGEREDEDEVKLKLEETEEI